MKKNSIGRSSITMLFLLLLAFASVNAQTGGTSSFTVYGLTNTNSLVRFNSAQPNTILSTTPITGLQTGENVTAIDFRPATGQLFALGAPGRLYTINTTTGAATFVAALSTFPTGSNLPDYGFDFNPTVDRIRLVTNTDFNGRINPADGATTQDTALAFAAGDVNAAQNPNVVAAGYTNSFGGATSTILYDIDSNLDILVRQDPPNNGTLNTIGSLGVNASGETGFDIASGNNAAFASIQTGVTASSLYSINLTSGAATLVGAIGGGAVIRDIAIGRNRAAGGSTATIDFDGDGKTDYSVFRLSENNWYINRSSNGTFSATNFGSTQTDILTPGDYDGDGKTDIAVWRTTNGVFYYLRSSDGGFASFQWGQPGDEPIARDYDGDGKTDFSVVRRENGQATWFINNSMNGSVRIEQFGLSSDTVASGDYDGDGKFDLGVYRGTLGQPATFFIRQSTAGFRAVQWGSGGDLIVPGDYDGDGKTDFAVVRQGQPYTWYILRSSDNQLLANTLGTKPHFTTQGDYDGDGKTDISVFDPEFGFFYVFRSSNNSVISTKFGQNGDYPIANYDTH
jgi:hypothetical protein